MKFKTLDLNKCKTNEDVVRAISSRVAEASFEDLKEHIQKEFVFVDDTLLAIYTGLTLSKNVYISGMGGFGKSEIVKAVLEFYKIPYSVISGYKDMPVEAMLGIPNMEKLLKDSLYEINFKESVFGTPGVLIGEEFGDILPSTAAALKDILSEKGFRYKGKKLESLISCMIITSNKTPYEIADDDSKRAFYISRFPIKVTMDWKKYGKTEYYKLLDLKFKSSKKLDKLFIAKLLTNNAKKHGIVAPRTSLEIMEAYSKHGLSFVKNFDVDLTDVHELLEAAREEETRLSQEEYLKDIEEGLDNAIVNKDIGAIAVSYFVLDNIKISTELISKYTNIKDKAVTFLKKMSTEDKNIQLLNYYGVDEGT